MKRPGYWPFGERLANRKTDFICYAARQVEEIDVEFADGLPLPKKLEDVVIDNLHFSYRAISTIDTRTLKIRRELISKVASQVCSSTIEAEISEPLKRVARSLKERMSFIDERASVSVGGKGAL
jgi:hypothetical protein